MAGSGGKTLGNSCILLIGGYNPSLQAFGADQLDSEEELPSSKDEQKSNKKSWQPPGYHSHVLHSRHFWLDSGFCNPHDIDGYVGRGVLLWKPNLYLQRERGHGL
ncbi:hypothetical protein GBA52_011946 [Prunus armeniaca]|nr:hypothetical protein GBA52_011946 [Prunus armeniaca]